MLSLGSLPAVAQEQVDPPGRIGRVSDFAGELNLAADDQGRWGGVEVNYPVTTGDELWVPDDGRAEIEFGSGAFRLAGNTQVRVSRLDDRALELYLVRGKLIVRLRSLGTGEQAVVSTPNAQLRIDSPGTYRIEVHDGPATRVVVREGEAELVFGHGREFLGIDRMAEVEGESGERVVFRAPFGVDGFEAWSIDRDRRIDSTVQSNPYVSPEMIGAHELDAYGAWQQYPEYGAVWFPSRVGPEWAPYRDGRWVWVAPWGWTWVDNAPWGFAPFHYGRWLWLSGRWGWAPGHYDVRPVYAPALVAWYGGPGWSAGVSVGGPVYGWVPLGWGDPYWPQHRVSTRYWRSLNRPYAVNWAERRNPPPTRYSNHHVPGAVTAVPGTVFRGERPIPVSPNRVRVPQSAWTQAPVLSAPPSTHKPMRAESAPRAGIAPPPVVGPRLPQQEWASRARDRSTGAPRGPTAVPLPGSSAIAPYSPGASPVAPSAPPVRGPAPRESREIREQRPESRPGAERAESPRRGVPPDRSRVESVPRGIGAPPERSRGEVVVPRPAPEVQIPRPIPSVPSTSAASRIERAAPPARVDQAPPARIERAAPAARPEPSPSPRAVPPAAVAPRMQPPQSGVPQAPRVAPPSAPPPPRVAPSAAISPAPAAPPQGGRVESGGSVERGDGRGAQRGEGRQRNDDRPQQKGRD